MTRQDLSERDQKAAKESFESFKELVTRFPEFALYAGRAPAMNYIVNSLAQYEVHVARYYYNRGAYLAAINRAQTGRRTTAKFRRSKRRCTSCSCPTTLGMNDLRDDTQRVLTTNYPKSEYLTRGFRAKDDPWWKLW